MNTRFRLTTSIFVFVLASCVAFSGDGLARETVEYARPDYQWDFPRDHQSHPEYRTEWWYLTGVLEGDNREFGYQFTIFRQRLGETVQPGSHWFTNQVYLGHFSWIDLNQRRHQSFRKQSRELPGVAGGDTVVGGSIRVRSAVLTPGDPWKLRVGFGDTRLQLRLSPRRSPLFQGPGGYSQKGPDPGQASQYYSYTRMTTEGRLHTDSATVSLRGTSWFDQEFGSSQLSEAQEGWDWISLRLSDGSDFMVYRLREEDGSITPESSATLRRPDGSVEYLGPETWSMQPVRHWKSDRTGARYPVAWEVSVPSRSIDLSVSARFPDQEMVLPGSMTAPYWEGVIQAEGTVGNRSVTGEGFLELTGYVASLSGMF